MIALYTNSAGTKRLIRNGASATFKDQNVLSAHNASEVESIVAKHHLVELPVTHRSFTLSISANAQQLMARVTLFELEKNLPGIWFRGEITRTQGPVRTVPCYFTFVPVRKKRGVYEFRPMVNMIHMDGSDLAMFAQNYDAFEPIKESSLKASDYIALGVIGKTNKRKSA